MWQLSPLGLAGVTSPGAAIVGTILLVSYDGIRRNFSAAFWRRSLLLVTCSVLISAAVYIGYVYPYVIEAWQQDRVLRGDRFYSTATFLETIRTNPLWAVATLSPIFAAIGIALYAFWRKPPWLPRDGRRNVFSGGRRDPSRGVGTEYRSDAAGI